MSDRTDRRSALLILGMHRSGTSALARVLNLLGADLGPSLLPANADNETGFWEPREIVTLHDELLATLGSSWHDPRPLAPGALAGEAVAPFRAKLIEILRRDFGQSPLAGFKDPRLCRLAPLWKDVLAETGFTPGFVLTCRHPEEVAASLATRNKMSRAVSHLLWLDHALTAERDTRGTARVFVTYEGLLKDWRSSMKRVTSALALPSDTLDAAAPAIDAFLDTTKRHHAVPAAIELPALLRDTLAVWQRAAVGENVDEEFDALRARFAEGADLLLPWTDELRANIEHERLAVKTRGARVAKLTARVTELERLVEKMPATPAATPGEAATATSVEAAAATAATAVPASPSRDLLLERPGTRIARTYEVPEGDPRVSIVIPLYGQCALTAKCLVSIAAHTTDGTYEVILVDNASSDETPELLSALEGNVKIVVNERNLGFATACNQGAALAAAPNVLFLNNDIEVGPNWLPPLLDVLDKDASTGVVGAKLLFPDGRIQHAGVAVLRRANATLPIGAFHVHYGEPGDLPAANRASEYQVVTGACLLARKRVFEEAQGFDDFFWNGCEDIDFCLKVREKGWKVVYEPKSVLVHHESRSGAERWSRTRSNETLLASRWAGRVEADLVEENGSRRRTEAGHMRDWAPPREAAPGVVNAAPDVLTSIVILARNQIAHTRLCVASIEKHTPEPHEILIVDNGSTDDTREYLKSLVCSRENVRVVANAGNLGFAAGNNQALALARGRRIVLLNNDTVVTEGWLGGLHDVLDEHPGAGIVGPMTNNASGPQVLRDASYRTAAEMEEFATRLSREHEGASGAARRIVGFCWLMRREVLETIGGLDERFGTGNCEDDDYCLRAHQHGFGTRIARGVFVHHVGGSTFAGEKIDYHAALLSNWELFKEKWDLPRDASADQPYPFSALVAKERRPRVPLPDLAATHEPTHGGRWLADRRASAASAFPAVHAPARPERAERSPASAASGASRRAAAKTTRQLTVGVTDAEGEIGAGVLDLLRRYGHTGAPQRWRSVADLRDGLTAGGLVLLLDPDVTVPEDALQEMVALATTNAKAAAVGPVSNAAPASQCVAPADVPARDAARNAKKRRRRHRGRWTAETSLGSFCVLLNAVAVAEAGGVPDAPSLDEGLTALFARLRNAGFVVACARGAWVHRDENAHDLREAPLASEAL